MLLQILRNKISGPQAVMLVMEGSHYVRGKRGMVIIGESILLHAKLSFFYNSLDTNKDEDLFIQLT